MKSCCEKEINRSIKHTRDVATCDQCKFLILAYGDETDFQKMVIQLEKTKIPFETGVSGKLKIVVKTNSLSP